MGSVEFIGLICILNANSFFDVETMTVRFRLDVLGGCKLVDVASGESFAFRSRKARCLIGLVALWPGGSISRERLASFMWDPAPEELARSSLRQCLKEIREVLGDANGMLLDASRLDVRILQDKLDVDALQLASRIPAARSDRTLALDLARKWQGELFGEMVPAAPVFEAWVQVERSRYRALISNLLTDHLQVMIKSSDYSTPDLAEELVRIEPSHELAYQFLMRFHAARGDQAGALRQFSRLDKVLADELDSEPSQESLDLLVAIKRGDSFAKSDTVDLPPVPPWQPASAPTASQLPRIVIRPPLSRYQDESKDYLAEGFAGLLKVCLARFRCWVILSWPSTGFDSKIKVDFPTLGKAIGADYAIDAVFDWRQQQGQLLVSLIDCSDGSQVWSDLFPIGEFELQSMSNTVAGTISSKLASRINHIALLRYARAPSGAAAAYDLWLKGHQLSRSWSAKDDEQAQALFSKAIDLDPGLACAYASLASVLMTQGMVKPGYRNEAAERRRGFEMAQKALSLDPFDSRNHMAVAWSWLMSRTGERAEQHFRLAVDLNPFDSEILIASAMGMAFIGEIETSKAWARQAIQLNPLHPEYFLGYLAAIHYLSGDYPSTLEVMARCTDVFPETRAWTAAAHAKLENDVAAARAFDDFLSTVQSKWEEPTPADWDSVKAWLEMAVPIVSESGRAAFNEGLNKARDIHLGKQAA
jgi:DNA-binding SARP family transcriptional activator/TolB-like protein